MAIISIRRDNTVLTNVISEIWKHGRPATTAMYPIVLQDENQFICR